MANTKSLLLASASNQYAYIADASQTGLDITGDITLECWIKFVSLPSSAALAPFINKLQTATTISYSLGLYNDGTNYRLRFSFSSNGSSIEDLDSTLSLPSTGTWYHYVITWTASTSGAQFYVNGTNVGGATGVATSIFNSTSQFEIGKRTQSNTNLDGYIDDVRVWNTVRSSAQISANYQRELAGNESNLQGYWKLDNNYNDSTSNGNNLTPSGLPSFSTDVPFADSTTTSTSTTSTSTSTTSTSTSTTSTSTSRTTSTSTTSTSTSRTTSTSTTISLTTSTSTTSTSTSTTSTSTSTTSTSSSTSTTTSISTSTTTTLDWRLVVENIN